MSNINPFSRPLYVMLKPVGARCNLACDYCYYLDKQQLYREQPNHLMTEETLELFTKQYIEAQTGDDVLFTWHGGEALMRPLDFYRKAIKLQKRYAQGKRVANSIQTNGTLITEEWARFLRDNRWLVGVSIDGPQEVHDAYRLTRTQKDTGERRGSWARVRKGIDLLNRYHVEWNAMAVVNNLNAEEPLEFYRFFRDDLQCQFLQFTPIVEFDREGTPLPFNVAPQQWGKFLCAVFDEWLRRDVGQMFVQIFEATLANWMGVTPGVCSMAKECGHAGVMEFNGDVYSCDHFVAPEHKLGNIRQETLTALMYSDKQMQFGRKKHELLHADCHQCPWFFACHGECPKNRLADGRNYLCAGYRMFFEYAAPAMDGMKQLMQKGLPASDIMQYKDTIIVEKSRKFSKAFESSRFNTKTT